MISGDPTNIQIRRRNQISEVFNPIKIHRHQFVVFIFPQHQQSYWAAALMANLWPSISTIFNPQNKPNNQKEWSIVSKKLVKMLLLLDCKLAWSDSGTGNHGIWKKNYVNIKNQSETSRLTKVKYYFSLQLIMDSFSGILKSTKKFFIINLTMVIIGLFQKLIMSSLTNHWNSLCLSIRNKFIKSRLKTMSK